MKSVIYNNFLIKQLNKPFTSATWKQLLATGLRQWRSQWWRTILWTDAATTAISYTWTRTCRRMPWTSDWFCNLWVATTKQVFLPDCLLDAINFLLVSEIKPKDSMHSNSCTLIFITVIIIITTTTTTNNNDTQFYNIHTIHLLLHQYFDTGG